MADDYIIGLQPPQGTIFAILGLLPKGIWSNRNKATNNRWFVCYCLLLLFVMDFFYIGSIFYSENRCKGRNDDLICNLMDKLHMTIIINRNVEVIRTSLFLIAVNLLIVSTNVQLKRGLLNEILHNLRFFDASYGDEMRDVKRTWTSYIYPVVAVVMVNDCRRGAGLWHVTKNISRLYIVSFMELFCLLEIEIGNRFCALNDNLLKYKNWNKPFLVKCLDLDTAHPKREHLPMVQETRVLHRLLGDTVQLTNSFLGLQLFFCFSLAFHEASFLPVFAIHTFSKTLSEPSVNTMLWLTSGMIAMNSIVLYPILLVSNAHKTTKEANKTSKILTSVLNNQQLPTGCYKELRCLLLQLPQHFSRFTVLGMFDLRPPLLVNMLSLFSAYCLLIYQLQ